MTAHANLRLGRADPQLVIQPLKGRTQKPTLVHAASPLSVPDQRANWKGGDWDIPASLLLGGEVLIAAVPLLESCRSAPAPLLAIQCLHAAAQFRTLTWASCDRGAMTTTVSRGVYHHGKRHRFVATPKDDSPEAFEAALIELDDKVRAFTNATTPKIARQSYRRVKGN